MYEGTHTPVVSKVLFDKVQKVLALMSDKKSVQERILLLERNAAAWLEPMRKWLNEASMLDEIAKSKDYTSKKKIPSKKSSARTSPSTRDLW